ncbi:GNAT family N-acetyltransferase [Undibacterium sp. Di24W]|uniref:GNAT family N-acetyltransferase n=1 Tax=Undibacterium sp. Di24W TaxID=3413033 RepID=UPI003BF0ACE0
MSVFAKYHLGSLLGRSAHLHDMFNPITLPELNFRDPKAPLIELRPLCAADLVSWFDYLRLEEIRQRTSWNVNSPADLQQFIRKPDWSSPHAQIKFAIANKDDEQLIGTIGFHSISQTNQSAEIAYDLNPLYWGKGIATVACRALTQWAHQQGQFQRIQATVLDSNFNSRRVLERCGFNLEGHLKKYRIVRGESRDYWMFSHIL